MTRAASDKGHADNRFRKANGRADPMRSRPEYLHPYTGSLRVEGFQFRLECGLVDRFFRDLGL